MKTLIVSMYDTCSSDYVSMTSQWATGQFPVLNSFNFQKKWVSLICKSLCVEQLIAAVSLEYNSENDT